MDNPFFSIVIPTLNEEKYLPRLLKCLSLQIYKDFEVIVVDGKSEDATEKEYEKFKKNLLPSKFVVSERRSVGFQRNLGAKHAKGEYLLFLDADTMVGSEFLSVLKEKINKEHFIFATTWIVPDSKNITDKILLYFGNIATALANNFKVPLAGGYSTIIKRDIFTKLGGYCPDTLLNEDYDFSRMALRKNVRMKVLQNPKVVYSTRRFHSEGLIKLIPKMLGGQLYMFFVGPIKSDIFKYRMGGKAHERRQ